MNVSWSLWDGGRTRAEVAQAASRVDASRGSGSRSSTRSLALEVRQRPLEIDSGRAAVAAAADGVRAAAEARRVVAERYAPASPRRPTCSTREVALLQAELDRTRALAGVRLAEARLARALGR